MTNRPDERVNSEALLQQAAEVLSITYVAYVADYRHLADLVAYREWPCSEDLEGLSQVRASTCKPHKGLPYQGL